MLCALLLLLSAADGGAAPALPPAVVLDGVPAIPEALRERVGRFLESRGAELGGLSDDGRAVLLTTRFAQTPQVHVVRFPLGARTQLTFRKEPVTAPAFVPHAQAVSYLSDVGGDEQTQLYRQDLLTGAVTRLTSGQGQTPAYAWAWQGDRVAWTSTARNGKDFDVYLSDGVSAAGARLVLERSGMWSVLEWTRDGRRLLLSEYRSISDSALWAMDTATFTLTRLTPEAPTASYRAAAFDPKGARLYVATDREGDFVELYEVDLSKPSPKWTPLTRELRWNVEQLAVSPDGRTVAFTLNEDGRSTLHLLDAATRRARRLPQATAGEISGLRFAAAAPVLGWSASNATSPDDVFTCEVRTGKVVRWTESELGGLSRERLVEPTLARYPTFDGRSIPVFVYSPKGPGPHPVAVFLHGGPEAQARPSFSSLVQQLVVESGVAVLEPNVRGSDGYGKAYLALDNAEKREDSVKDVGALLDWVATQKELDPKRVAVVGGSYGGYMVLASLTTFPERLVAGVDVVGISNFVTFLERTSPYRQDLRRAEYGDERDPAMRAVLERISPRHNAGKIKSALFVAHGANDPRVPASEAEAIVKTVRQGGRGVWYMLAKNEGHGFQKKENRDLYVLLTVMFLEQQLGLAAAR